MRLNKYMALATGMGRRAADQAIAQQRVKVNNVLGQLGQEVGPTDKVTLDDQLIGIPDVDSITTIMLNKPIGYVCSRNGQGSKTIYDLLPTELHNLKPVGRLDKDSSGLLLLTNDGQLAQGLTHPSFQKSKVYELEIDKPLKPQDFDRITSQGVDIGDNQPSKFALNPLSQPPTVHRWQAILSEGRNRQIRRTFAALGYTVTRLHRVKFGNYVLGDLPAGDHKTA